MATLADVVHPYVVANVRDDIITIGGSARLSRDEIGETIESLFHMYYPRLVHAAFCLVADWSLAEQIAQDAYLRLWRRRREISDPQAAPLYLQRMIMKLSRETIRRQMTERRVLKAGRMERSLAPEHDPAAAAIVDLRRAIADLPAHNRECVMLRYLLGISEAETASLLGIGVDTVKLQTQMGLNQLRERLDGTTTTLGAAENGQA